MRRKGTVFYKYFLFRVLGHSSAISSRTWRGVGVNIQSEVEQVEGGV